ncbi:tea1, partial [Mucuna pruriens]
MRWEKVNGIGREGPGKRWGHTCNAVKGGKLLYLFGGYGNFNCQTNQVHVFDTQMQRWSELVTKGAPPSPRDSHSCTVVGDNLFVFGGTDGNVPLRDLHVLDTSSHTWIFPTVRGDLPEAREGHGAAAVGKRLFVFGGCGRSADNINEVYYNDLYILNTEMFIWMRATTSGTPPSPRDCHSCSSWKNKLIVLGGEDEHDYYLSDWKKKDIYQNIIYSGTSVNADTLVWRELCMSGQLLPPRAGHSTVSFGKNLFVFAGFTVAHSLYNDLYMLDLETGVWTKVTTTPNAPSARFSVAGDCLDPSMSGVLVFIGGCNINLEALDDMYYLYTGIARESELRPEKLSLRKQLKLKCLEGNPNLVQNQVLCGYEVGAASSHDMNMGLSNQPMAILNSQQSSLNIPVNQSLPPGKKMFQARVKERLSTGFTIETVIDGKPLHGILFSTNPNTLNPVTNPSSRKRTANEIGSVVSDSVMTSKVLKQERMEDRLELRGDSLQYHECHKEADTDVVSSTPITAAESSKVSVNPEPEAVSLNQNDEKNDTPKSLIESLKNDRSSDVTSSKGEVQTGDQINVPVSNYEIPRQTSDALNYNTDVLKPAAAEGAVTILQLPVNPEPEAVSLNQNDEKNDTPKSLIESLKIGGSSDVTSSQGEVQVDDQINMPVSNYEIPRKTSDAPNCDADVLEPVAAESAATILQLSVNPEPEAVSLNRNDEKNDTPKSLIECLKNDGSSDVTSSKGEDQAENQINVPGCSYEIPRQMSDAPDCNADVPEPAAAESAVTILQLSVNPEPEAVSLNQNDEKNDTPKSLIERLKNDGSNDETSSKGEVQAENQINVPVSNFEIRRQASDAPDCNTDVPEPAAGESAGCLSNQ